MNRFETPMKTFENGVEAAVKVLTDYLMRTDDAATMEQINALAADIGVDGSPTTAELYARVMRAVV